METCLVSQYAFFFFTHGGQRSPDEFIKADNFYKCMPLLDFVKYELSLICAEHIFVYF